MNGLSKKLYDLEENVVSDAIKEESCVIDISDAPESEKQLHKTAQSIVSHIKFENITPEQRELIEHSCRLLSTRILILFRKTTKLLFFLEDTILASYWDTRFMWFISETAKLGEQAQEIEQLKRDNPNLSEDDLDDKITALENTQQPLFTEKSFDLYEIEIFQKSLTAKYEREKQPNETREQYINRVFPAPLTEVT